MIKTYVSLVSIVLAIAAAGAGCSSQPQSSADEFVPALIPSSSLQDLRYNDIRLRLDGGTVEVVLQNPSGLQCILEFPPLRGATLQLIFFQDAAGTLYNVHFSKANASDVVEMLDKAIELNANSPEAMRNLTKAREMVTEGRSVQLWSFGEPPG